MKHLVDMELEERKMRMRQIGTERAIMKHLNKLKEIRRLRLK